MDQDPNSIEPTSEACLFSGLAFLVQFLRAGVGRRRRKVDFGFLVRVSKSESVGDSRVGWVGVVRTAAGIRRRTRGGFVNGQGGRANHALHGNPGRSGIEGWRGTRSLFRQE
ncbi:hypothetical protein FA13DRAFT_1468224 [Coprinellus micaceus]|uniref:Uncharacterized protein n=1 Tax=Coprinellus micaceus TaxID=71717 RepID=A0A4Y7SM88_COPMI|nr:hypothetical protein FA13DRAFT_1468224 [Coprinellus micaceus]